MLTLYIKKHLRLYWYDGDTRHLCEIGLVNLLLKKKLR